MEIPNLTSEQMFLIEILAGILAAVIVQLVKLALAWFGIKIGREPVSFALFLVAAGLGFWWLKPTLPPFPIFSADPAAFIPALFGWLGQIVAVGALIVGYATVIYNVLVKKIFDKIGWNSEQMYLNTLMLGKQPRFTEYGEDE